MGERAHNVNVDEVESSVRCRECRKGGQCVSVHLTGLAVRTSACPLGDIFVDAGPYISSSEEAPGGTDAWVREGV